MVRLVFVDLDDTFVTPEKVIPPENLRVLDLACERGAEVVPCTGRSVRGLPPELRDHPCVRHAVCSGGALVYDLRTGEAVRRVPIEREVVRSLYGDVRGQRITFDLTAEDSVLTAADRWPVYGEVPLDEATLAMVLSQRTRFEGTTERLIESMDAIYRVNVLFTSDDGRRAVWDAVDARPELCRAQSLSANVEITSAQATKGTALLWLCERLGVDPADTVAFGDSTNDLPMIEVAGDGVAMGNAVPEVMAVADHVAPPCTEAGVARYLWGLLGA